MSTDRQKRNFWDEVVEPAVVPATNMELLDEVLDWVQANFAPDEVFSEDDLKLWAKDNDYVKED